MKNLFVIFLMLTFFLLPPPQALARGETCQIAIDRPSGFYGPNEQITITANTSNLDSVWFFYVKNLKTQKEKQDGNCRLGNCPAQVVKTYPTNNLIADLGGRGKFQAYMVQSGAAGASIQGWYTRCRVNFCITTSADPACDPTTDDAIDAGKCDLCGWCDRNRDGYLDGKDQKPDYWDTCNRCVSGQTLKTGAIPVPGVWTALGCVPRDINRFIEWVLKTAIALGGGITFLLMIFGAFQIIVSSGDPEKLNSGKEILTSAVAGLLMIIFSVVLLKIIGYDILRIPGIKVGF